MKKAIVVGGSNGIGLAISCNLIQRGFHVIIIDRQAPSHGYLLEPAYTYLEHNLLDGKISEFERFARDPDVKLLMITAGVGRVCSFEKLHMGEIRNLLNINLTSVI